MANYMDPITVERVSWEFLNKELFETRRLMVWLYEDTDWWPGVGEALFESLKKKGPEWRDWLDHNYPRWRFED